MSYDEDDLKFIEKDEINKIEDENRWKILVVDDEKSIHTITKLVLKEFSLDNRKVTILNAYSKADAKKLLEEHKDIALALLDVVMETDEAGLELVKYIREDLKNSDTRIVIRTGEPGVAPEEKIIKEYDINDYKDKTELTNIKLFTTVYSALKSYRDIQNLKELQKELRKQEDVMIAQARHAAMGEMIGMIAHQWRQPLNVIAMEANNVLIAIHLEVLDEKELKEHIIHIVNQTQELSHTISDFKNFFSKNKKFENIFISEIIDNILQIVGISLENNDIEFKSEIEKNYEINTYGRELMQVLVNIINNAKEAFIGKNIQDKQIVFHIKQDNKNTHINICDNAGGITEDIIKYIFDPYFTTKEGRNGTGLGLYMCKTIINKHLRGTITAVNQNNGCCIKITLPKIIDEEKNIL